MTCHYDVVRAIFGVPQAASGIDATLAVGEDLSGPFLNAVNASKDGLGNLESAARAASSAFVNDLAVGAKKAMETLTGLGERADTVYAQLKRAVGLANDADKVKAAVADVRQAEGEVKRRRYGRDVFGTSTDDEVTVAELERQRKIFNLQDIDGTKEKSDATRKVLANAYGPQLPKDWEKSDDDEKASSGRRGGASPAAKDRSEEVIAALRQEADLTSANAESRKKIVEQIRLANELTRAGVSLDSEQGQEIEGLVRRLYAAKEAAEQNEKAARGVNEAWSFAGNQVLSIVDGIGEGGKKAGEVFTNLAKTILKAAEQAALLGQGPLAGVLGMQGGANGAPGGLFGMLAGLFKGGFSFGGGGYDPFSGFNLAAFDPFSNANGGFVGRTTERVGRRIPLSAWMGAPAYALGGAVGPGARAIIARDGELVLNTAQQRNVADTMRMLAAPKSAGSAPSEPMQVVINNNHSGANVTAREAPDGNGGRRLDVQIDEMVAGAMGRGRMTSSALRNQGVRPGVIQA